MDIKRIQQLYNDWHVATWKVIELKNIDLKEVKKLFDETYKLIEEYSKEKLVPKEISGVLLEMHDFGWWVSDLDDTPLHKLYQEIVSVVNGLNKYFLTRDANVDAIIDTIERIGE